MSFQKCFCIKKKKLTGGGEFALIKNIGNIKIRPVVYPSLMLFNNSEGSMI